MVRVLLTGSAKAILGSEFKWEETRRRFRGNDAKPSTMVAEQHCLGDDTV